MRKEADVPCPVAAIVDIGSNSIKLLVATRAADGTVFPLKFRTLDARIGAGLGRANPELSAEGITRGVEAVVGLLATAAPFGPTQTLLVATSAVRDARNGDEFRAAVARETGHPVRLLSGREEANLIGRGLTCDPTLADRRNFYVFDLGGGSLECLAFRDRRIEQAVSLPLGCVRLTEQFVPEPSAPFPAAAAAAISDRVRATLAGSGFRFALPRESPAIATGGTASTVRSIRAARDALDFERTDAEVKVPELAGLLSRLGALPLAERRAVAGLPPARADVFPAALATFLAVADAGGFGAFLNSGYNLRYGLADEILPA